MAFTLLSKATFSMTARRLGNGINTGRSGAATGVLRVSSSLAFLSVWNVKMGISSTSGVNGVCTIQKQEN